MARSSALAGSAALLAVIGAGGATGRRPIMDSIRHPAFSWHLSHGRFPLNIVDAVIHGAAAVLPTGWLPAHKLTRPTIDTGCDGLTTFPRSPLGMRAIAGRLAAVGAATSLLSGSPRKSTLPMG